MGTLYTSQSAAGYNSSPPPDDGSQGANNQITWGTTIKAKLADPIKALADAINSQLTTALDLSPRAISTPDSAVASDHWRTLQVTGTTTITLSDAATMTSKYVVGIANTGTGVVTVTRATGANTINGAAADITLQPKAAVVLSVNQAANGYNVGASTGIALTSLTTPIIDSGSTGPLSLRTNNGETGFVVNHGGTSLTNRIEVVGNTTGNPAALSFAGSDANVTGLIRTKGTGVFTFVTDAFGVGPVQFQVLHTASSTRNITITGSNGGNPTIGTTAGSLAITPATIIAGGLTPNFTSSETALGAQNSNTTFSHGLGAVPKHYRVVLRNKTAELGYSIGDEVPLEFCSGSTPAVYSDSSVIGVLQPGANISVLTKNTQVSTSVTTADWKYVVYAWI